MTDEEWQTCDDWAHLLRTARAIHPGEGSRKMRLLACAFARSVLPVAIDPRIHETLVIAENLADDFDDALRHDTRSEMAHWYRDLMPKSQRYAATAIYYTLASASYIDVRNAAQVALRSRDHSTHEKQLQADSVRDLFGGPAPLFIFNRAWRTQTAFDLARAMYDSRDFGAMPILADALQDAGCEEGVILNHCRDAQQHVRGCWVVDWVLGKV